MAGNSTPLRRSTRGIPLVSPAKSPFVPNSGTTYQWLGAPLPTAGPSTATQVYYNGFMRIIEDKRASRGKGKSKEKIAQLMFRVGDGVLIGTVGDVGVAVLTRLWEQPVEEDGDEDEMEDDDSEQVKMEKMCEIRWCYRKKDLPGVIGKIQLSDHEVLYATSATKPVTQIVSITALVHTCNIIGSEPFRARYPYYHHSYKGAEKYIAVFDPNASSDEDDEEDGPDENGHNHPPTLTLTVSDRIFHRGKGLVPLVYYCTRAFDKFAAGGRGSAWWEIDIEEVLHTGRKEGLWDVEAPKRTREQEEEDKRQDLQDKEEAKARRKEEAIKREKRTQRVEMESDSGSSGDDAFVDEEESASDGIDEGVEESEDDGEDEEGEEGDHRAGNKRSRSRKRKARTTSSRPAKNRKTQSARSLAAAKAKSKARLKARLKSRPAAGDDTFVSVPVHLLPKDPFERALHLLHVGATPDSLPKRETEYLEVLSRVQEGVESGNGGCLYIAGVPGTGKTATVHAVIKDLRRQVEDYEIPPFSYVEINGLKIPTPQHAYSVLWDAISGTTGSSAKTALRSLEEHFGVVGKQRGRIRGPRGHTFVVLMDELDQLLTAKQDVVYNFFNWPTLRDSQLFVIAVANRMDLPQQLAAKVKSRLGMQSLYFQPYDREALMAIAQSRLIAHPQDSRDPQVLHPEAIRLAAMKMAGTNGDARRVLDACRRAVEVAIENGKQTDNTPVVVSVKDMQNVLKALTSSPVALFIKQCSLYEKIMLAAVLRCVRREGVPEISWLNVCRDHDNLIKSMFDTPSMLSNAELQLVFSSLLATRTLTYSNEKYKVMNDRKLALGLGMDANEVGRVLMAEGEDWARVLAGL